MNRAMKKLSTLKTSYKAEESLDDDAFFSGDKSDDELCLTNFSECCREPTAVIKNENSLGWRVVNVLRKWSIGLLAIGSTIAALILYQKNKRLHRRLDAIREDWKYLKQERLRLKGELCRLKRSKALTDEEIRKTAEMNNTFFDSMVKERERSNSDDYSQVERMKREMLRLHRELDQSYREREMLNEKLEMMIRRNCSSSYQQ